MAPLYTAVLLYMAGIGALLRGVVVTLDLVRTLYIRKRFRVFHFGWVEKLVAVEPLILIAVAYQLFRSTDMNAAPTTREVLAATFGAAIVIAGWGVVVWTLRSWPSLFAGHGVLENQEVVTRGAYGVVRHPVYLGALLIWLGLALAFSSTLAFGITLLYVIPAYLLYIRAEEQMMLQSFGESYASYRKQTPMLIPRFPFRKRAAADD